MKVEVPESFRVGIIIDGKMQMEGSLSEVYSKTNTDNMEDAFFEAYYKVKGRDE